MKNAVHATRSATRRPIVGTRFRPLAALALLGLCALPSISQAANGTWTALNSGIATGLWSDPLAWSGNVIADGAGSTAFFNTLDITGASVIHLDTARTIGNLTFGDADTNTGANWTLDNNGNAANILTLSGAAPTITVGALGVANTLTITAVLAGTGGLTFTGPNTTFMAGNIGNTYTGGTIVKSRVETSNNNTNAALTIFGSAVATNTLTFDGGYFKIANTTSATSAGTLVNNMIVNTTGTLEFSGRSAASGTLTGGGIFNVITHFVRSDNSGNWSGFTGTINASSGDAGIADFRQTTYNGFTGATLNLGTNANMYVSSGTPTVPVYTLYNPFSLLAAAFGTSVAISGTQMVIGAPLDGSSTTATGRAYVYNLGSFTPVATLNNSGPAVGDQFGGSVAMSGTQVVIGAPYDDTGAIDAGSAYVYVLSSSTPTVPVTTLNNPAPTLAPNFGASVAISSTRIVVGAPANGTGASGRAYVYNLGSPTPVATLNGSGQGDGFGATVAISGTRVVIGASDDSTGATAAGSAYVYDLSSGTPTTPIVTLHNPNPAAYGHFGRSVAISSTRVVIGASGDNTGAFHAGSAYVYDVSSGTPTAPVITLHNPTPATYDNFGTSVAISGTQVVVGARGDDTVMLDKGFAYVFGPSPNDQDGDGVLDTWEIAHFGTTVGHTGMDDDDHDGLTNLLEEAFGTDPLVPNTAANPNVVNEGGSLTVTIAKQPGVTYQVQSAAALGYSAFRTETTTVLINDATTLKVRDNALVGTPPSRFLRVKVTAAP